MAVIAGNLELAEVIQSHKQEDVGKNYYLPVAIILVGLRWD